VKKRGRKGYKAHPQVPVIPHALERLREHWPDSSFMYDAELRFILSDQLLEALNKKDFVVAPGGVYVPFSLFGKDGYAVLVNQKARTVMPTDWCPEVDLVRKTRT